MGLMLLTGFLTGLIADGPGRPLPRAISGIQEYGMCGADVASDHRSSRDAGRNRHAPSHRNLGQEGVSVVAGEVLGTKKPRAFC